MIGTTGSGHQSNCSEWGAPIVAVLKADGCVRISGDYNVTIRNGPLPICLPLKICLPQLLVRIELDLLHAYQQVELEPTSRRYVTVSMVFISIIGYRFLVTSPFNS